MDTKRRNAYSYYFNVSPLFFSLIQIRQLDVRHGGEWACRVDTQMPRPPEDDLPSYTLEDTVKGAEKKEETVKSAGNEKQTIQDPTRNDVSDAKRKSLSIYVIHRDTKYCPVNGEYALTT